MGSCGSKVTPVPSSDTINKPITVAHEQPHEKQLHNNIILSDTASDSDDVKVYPQSYNKSVAFEMVTNNQVKTQNKGREHLRRKIEEKQRQRNIQNIRRRPHR